MKAKSLSNALFIGLAGMYTMAGIFYADNYTFKLCLWAIAVSHIGLLFPVWKHHLPFVVIGLVLIIISQLI